MVSIKNLYYFLFTSIFFCASQLCHGAVGEEKTESKSEKVTRTAHFVYGLWDSKPMPQVYQETLRLWKEQGWNVKLWNPAEVNQLLSVPEYHSYQKTYANLNRNIQKADFIRYLIIFHEGGFYFDLDCQPTNKSLLADLNTIPTSKDIFFVECVTSPEFAKNTANWYPIRRGKPECCQRIANFAFAGQKGSPILAKILQLASERCALYPIIAVDYDIIYTTGPDCVTEVVSTESHSVTLLTNTKEYLNHLETNKWRNGGDKAD